MLLYVNYHKVFYQISKLGFVICWNGSNNMCYQIVLNIRADRHLYGHLNRLSKHFIVCWQRQTVAWDCSNAN